MNQFSVIDQGQKKCLIWFESPLNFANSFAKYLKNRRINVGKMSLINSTVRKFHDLEVEVHDLRPIFRLDQSP
jgi:mannose/fructose/N-acetylgalactosamine-specific phosphotransferase system component IIB